MNGKAENSGCRIRHSFYDSIEISGISAEHGWHYFAKKPGDA